MSLGCILPRRHCALTAVVMPAEAYEELETEYLLCNGVTVEHRGRYPPVCVSLSEYSSLAGSDDPGGSFGDGMLLSLLPELAMPELCGSRDFVRRHALSRPSVSVRMAGAGRLLPL